MRTLRTISVILIPVVVLLIASQPVMGWGFWAHKEIHQYAIRSLPKEMRPFFDAFADTIIARSVEPDQRRYRDPKEGFYHYLDIDRYGSYPFTQLPKSYDEAVLKFGKSKVDSNGTVTWRIADFVTKLSEAMKKGDKKSIIFYASNLGHYIADAHVPLHSTENYDGQLSNQKGIHARWESHIPERFGKDFKLSATDVEYIGDPLVYAFDVILRSYTMVDSVLRLDLKAREGIPKEELMKASKRKGRTEYQFGDTFYERYHELLNGMVERRLKDSIKGVASCWYTAWVNAGKPDLSSLASQ